MSTIEHIVAPEDLMAYLDGEVPPERAASVREHLLECSACQSLAADLRNVSDGLCSWQVEPPPDRLKAPGVGSDRGPLGRLLFARWSAGLRHAAVAAGAIVALGAAILFLESRAPRYSVDKPDTVNDRVAEPLSVSVGRSAGGARASAQEAPAPKADPRGPQIVRTVTLTIVTRDFAAVRPAVDRILQSVGGFVGNIQVSGEANTGSLQGTLRVPANRLAEAVAALRALGRVLDESQTGDDVSEQVRDLEARLTNSRNTEKRLANVLQNRTGRVSEILEVEREIARVREEIERMDAERQNLERRVAYATITLHVSEQRQASLDMGPQPLSTKFRNATVDGLRDAFESVLGLTLWLLRVGPTLLLWVVVLWWPVRFAIRRGRAWTAPAQ